MLNSILPSLLQITRKLFWVIVFFSTFAGIYNVYKPLPVGTHTEGVVRNIPANAVSFYSDSTYVDSAGARHSDQQIFDEIFRIIKSAKRFILIDMFLYNSYQGAKPEKTRALSEELTNLLLKKKKEIPDISITVITDPINEIYGGNILPQFEELRKAGIAVVTTNLSRLRDSNPLYSGFWRAVFQMFGNSPSGGIMPNPFQSNGNKVSIRSWLSLLNFKANHRKLIVADGKVDGETKLITLITSANPHDGSSAHGNIAIEVSDFLYRDAIVSEQAVAEFSHLSLQKISGNPIAPYDETGSVGVSLLTEGAIKDRLLKSIEFLSDGDSIDIAMFYLSERNIINALVQASTRGVEIRIILDPNKDAFGHAKNGVPNRPVAEELVSKTKSEIKIRWCDSHGEQCHAKLVLIHGKNGYEMLGGSANLTRRNISDYNLETDISVTSKEKIKAIADAFSYFDKIWNNIDAKIYTADYGVYKDTSIVKKLMYRIMELTGMSSF